MKKVNVNSENILISELRNGGVQAYEELYKKYSLRLFHFGLKYLKSEVEAEGLVQDVFTKIWENRTSLKTGHSFKAYIFTIAFNFIKKSFIKRNKYREYLEGEYKPDEMDFSTTNEINYQSLMSYLNTLVEQLPEKRREIFIKSRIEDISVKEIAAQMGISPKTVENQLTAAIKFIKSNWKVHNLPSILSIFLFVVKNF